MDGKACAAEFDKHCAQYAKAWEGAKLDSRFKVETATSLLGEFASTTNATDFAQKIVGLVAPSLAGEKAWLSRVTITLEAIVMPFMFRRDFDGVPFTPVGLKVAIRHWIEHGELPPDVATAPHADLDAINGMIKERLARDKLRGPNDLAKTRLVTMVVLAYALEGLVISESIGRGEESA